MRTSSEILIKNILLLEFRNKGFASTLNPREKSINSDRKDLCIYWLNLVTLITILLLQ